MSGHAHYYNAPDLDRFGEISQGAPALAEKFFAWYGAVMELPVAASAPRTIFDAELVSLGERAITVGPHCFGCTAGAGSSCGGATA